MKLKTLRFAVLPEHTEPNVFLANEYMEFKHYVVNSGLVDVAFGTIIGGSTMKAISGLKELINKNSVNVKSVKPIAWEFLLTIALVFVAFYLIVLPLFQNSIKERADAQREAYADLKSIRDGLQKVFFL